MDLSILMVVMGTDKVALVVVEGYLFNPATQINLM
jgi:hypothetical protein